MKNVMKIVYSALMLMITAVTTQAGDIQSIDSITKAARAHVINSIIVLPHQQLEVSHIQIDKRLRLKKCRHKLQTFTPAYQRRGSQTTVGISCTLPKPWKIYVPVKISLQTPVIVSQRQLNPGDIIQAQDLRLETQSVSHLNYGYFDQESRVIGQKVKQVIGTGTILTPHMLASLHVIKRGQIVIITATMGGINISTQGKALMDGRTGDTIRVKNTSSGKIIEGAVQENGTVSVKI